MRAVLSLARRLASVAVLAVIFLAAAPRAGIAEAVEPSITPLVEVAWVLEQAGRDEVVLLDIRNKLDGGSEEVYRAGHIPGAVYSDYLKAGWRTERDGVPGQLPHVETLEALIGELGIGNDSHVVVVSAGTTALDMGSATRVYWTFKVLGHDKVSILDGGYRAYTSDPANPVESGWVAPLPDIFSAEFQPELVADRAMVQTAMQAGRSLVDNRPTEFYLGQKRHTWAKRAGTIPGAVSVPEALYADGQGRFVKSEGVADLLQRVGITSRSAGQEDDTIVFCNTGHWASLGWFAQSEILGRSNVRVYDGSMVDWTAVPERPVQSGSVATQ